jgi:hypothetical protein
MFSTYTRSQQVLACLPWVSSAHVGTQLSATHKPYLAVKVEGLSFTGAGWEC